LTKIDIRKKVWDKHNPLETIEKSDNYALKQHDVNVKILKKFRRGRERKQTFRERERKRQRDR
jgi:hypothetical protein